MTRTLEEVTTSNSTISEAVAAMIEESNQGIDRAASGEEE